MPIIGPSMTLRKTGDVQLSGDVTLSQGTNVTLTQSGNDISIAASGGSSTITEATVTFSTSQYQDVLTTSIADAAVTGTSKIIAYVSRAGAGRDADEMEMEQFTTAVTSVGTGTFDVSIVNNSTGGAESTYILSYSIA